MSQYRERLPQLGDELFLTDGGLETTLIFHDGMELPCFASFLLLETAEGMERLRRYYHSYMAVAASRKLGFVLETPTWRANTDWGVALGYDADALAQVNRDAVNLLKDLRETYQPLGKPVVISGNIGPRRDGYNPADPMSSDEARRYHTPQIEAFADSAADMLSAFTINYSDEAVGIVQAARDAAMPITISFTLETDGTLPSGETLAGAIARTDEATDGHAAYYMINCAHPTHFQHLFEEPGSWIHRIGGLRANASKRSHAELDNSTDLDDGDPEELGTQYRSLLETLPGLRVLGGCCGTDHRHVAAIGRYCNQAADNNEKAM